MNGGGETRSQAWRMKAAVLSVLVLQNSASVLLLRYSRTIQGPKYLASTAVLLGEVLKLVTCVIVLYNDLGGWEKMMQSLWFHVVQNHTDFLKLSVPALLYLVQNNLIFVAISNLEAAPYQVLYQLKIFTTAVLSVLLLGKELTRRHWVALATLFLGVVLVQLSTISNEKSKLAEANPLSSHDNHDNEHMEQVERLLIRTLRGDDDDDGQKKEEEAIEKRQDPIIGFLAILVAVCCSGLSGVWFERILKRSATSLWIRNFQLAVFSLVLAIGSVAVKDFDAVIADGFFQGYNSIVICVVIVQAGGGLIVALVMKYADNILKGFACSLATILSTIVSILLFDFHASGLFTVGATLVLGSVFAYGNAEMAYKSEQEKQNLHTRGPAERLTQRSPPQDVKLQRV